ncbi:MAG: rhodanese-like domain-containing protein [Gammaproteobacteria bacterium]|nr:MAG: rhodanese-like domain-containing protein [Gammaproteobacteria bacterium]
MLIYLFIFVEQKKAGKQISVHDVTSLINSDEGILLDVRDSKEYQSGHIINALNIPLAKLDSRLTELEKYRDKKVVLIDKLGQHSAAAGRKLRASGFDVLRLQGGMGEWRSQSLPVVSE